jgi:hypothetical protein
MKRCRPLVETVNDSEGRELRSTKVPDAWTPLFVMNGGRRCGASVLRVSAVSGIDNRAVGIMRHSMMRCGKRHAVPLYVRVNACGSDEQFLLMDGVFRVSTLEKSW